MGQELLWEGAICGDGGICGKVHLEAFSLERKEVMRILFKRGLQRPLEGDNGLPFSSWWEGRPVGFFHLSEKGGQWDFSSWWEGRLVGVFIFQCSWSYGQPGEEGLETMCNTRKSSLKMAF